MTALGHTTGRFKLASLAFYNASLMTEAHPNMPGRCVLVKSTPKGQGELQADIANLQAGMAKNGAKRAFMNAASPGVISPFLQISITRRERPIWQRWPM